MLLRSGCPLRLTARLRTPCAAGLFGPSSHLENCESRNSFEVSQSCGLKNDHLCSRPLRVAATCAADFSSGPAVTRRTVNGCYGRAHCATGLPEDFTCPVTLDGPVRLGARSLHLSCHTGQARTTGLRTNRQNCQLAAVLILRLCLSDTSF